ncbi:MAG: hypothetical protein JSW58_03880, partial [Candidatus Latescibacterota bacterium]
MANSRQPTTGDTHKSRHIRDIAHLYISSVRSRSDSLSATLLIVGEDRGCFSGFHAANLGAALSAKGVSVHLFERSGLLPNSGFFMSLPPRQYIRWDKDVEAPIAGLGGAKISYTLKRSPALGDGARRPRVELIHLAPVHPELPFQEGLREARDFAGPVTILLVLRMGENARGEIIESAVKKTKPRMTCVL